MSLYHIIVVVLPQPSYLYGVPYLVCQVVLADTVRVAQGEEGILRGRRECYMYQPGAALQTNICTADVATLGHIIIVLDVGITHTRDNASVRMHSPFSSS